LGFIIEDVHRALVRAPAAAEPEKIELVPAVSIKRSVTPDYIVSLEDGKKFKSMKRYLMRAHGLTPDEYRAKWGLPRDYPMVAPNYAKARSDLARKMGLGRKSDVGAERKTSKARKRKAK
jgi:predicted transcriptional regulator